MKNTDETRFRIQRPIPSGVLWLLRSELLLSGIALAIALLPLCGRCGSGSWTHAIVAGGGVLGYAVLLLLYRKGFTTFVGAGVLAAGGVHAALFGMMMASGGFCTVCVLAALVAISNAAVVLLLVPGSAKWIPRALVPAFSLAWIVLFLAHQAEAAESSRVRQRAVHDLSLPSEIVHPAQTVLTVFEMQGCHYCREFRTSYAPKLSRDFQSLEIVYRQAEEVLWVRRTPTLALGDQVLFEGLPTDYATLSRAIRGKQVPSPTLH